MDGYATGTLIDPCFEMIIPGISCLTLPWVRDELLILQVYNVLIGDV
jgi:hypothetical protein